MIRDQGYRRNKIVVHAQVAICAKLLRGQWSTEVSVDKPCGTVHNVTRESVEPLCGTVVICKSQ